MRLDDINRHRGNIMIMKERLYLTVDGSKAVYQGDKRGATALCKFGDTIDQKTADKYGIIGGRLSALKPLEGGFKGGVKTIEEL